MIASEGFSQAEAREWVTHSLAQGHSVSRAILEQVPGDGGRILCLLPAEGLPPHGFRGGGFQSYQCSADLAELIRQAKAEGSECLVIEDESEVRGDPHVNKPPLLHAFDHDYVFRWIDLASLDPKETSDMFSLASAGYPTNALLLSADAGSLGLSKGHTVDERDLERVAKAAQFVIVSAFDAESYVIWELPRPDGLRG